MRRSEVQETVRSVTSLVLSETRPVTPGGIVVAGEQRLVYRTPLTLGGVCDVQGNDSYVFFPAAASEVDTAEVAGIGVRADDGTWSYYGADWSAVLRSPGQAASRCADVGADTVGARDLFQTLRLAGVTTPPPSAGDVIMVYRETEMSVAPSALDPGGHALFWGPSGGTLNEFGTGIADSTRFEYRTGGSTWQGTVTGANLALIDAIRIVAYGTARGESGTMESYQYGLTVDLPLRNVD